MSQRHLAASIYAGLSDREMIDRADRSFAILIVSAAAALIVALCVFIAIAGALWLATAPAHASGEFACRGVPFVHAQDKVAFARHAPNGTMRTVLIEYAHLWDAAEMERLCDARGSGQTVELQCLQGHRDWDAIVRMIPADIRAAGDAALRRHLEWLRSERAANRPHQKAINHCIRTGAIDGILQE